MSIFTSAKAKLAAQKLAEEQLYELAAEEIAANNIRPGLMAKALAETDGNVAAANARYLKLRVETMKAEADLNTFVEEEAIRANATRAKNEKKEQRDESAVSKVSAQSTGEAPSNGFTLGVIFLVFLYLAVAMIVLATA